MPDQVPDGFELVSNGTARLMIDGEVWRLRRPKVGEFRKLRELLHERDDERLRRIASQENHEKPAEDASQDEKLAYTLALAQRSRVLQEEVEDLDLNWTAQALTILADHQPPPIDDWPSGMGSSEFIQQLLTHWRSVPLRSGGS